MHIDTVLDKAMWGKSEIYIISQLPPSCNLETKSQFVLRKPKIKRPATDSQTDAGKDRSICQSKKTHQLQTSNCFHREVEIKA